MSAKEAGSIAVLTRERDQQRRRAELLAEALHGSYGTEHRWRLACEKAEAERDAARCWAIRLVRMDWQDELAAEDIEAMPDWLAAAAQTEMKRDG